MLYFAFPISLGVLEWPPEASSRAGSLIGFTSGEDGVDDVFLGGLGDVVGDLFSPIIMVALGLVFADGARDIDGAMPMSFEGSNFPGVNVTLPGMSFGFGNCMVPPGLATPPDCGATGFKAWNICVWPELGFFAPGSFAPGSGRPLGGRFLPGGGKVAMGP